ncbi:MAG: hypothetical protein KDK55_02130 [Chlamydiia bacterium]|nr:hypothetical protein [Chlamydiia bacterium]
MTIQFIRFFFVLLSFLFMLAYQIGTAVKVTPWTYLSGGLIGLLLGAGFMMLDKILAKFSLRGFTTILLGLFLGYLMGMIFVTLMGTIMRIAPFTFNQNGFALLQIFLLLLGSFMGVIMTARASDELFFSIPFVRFTSEQPHPNPILLDLSALSDPRLVDLAASGILDNRLILPRFILKKLIETSERGDEGEAAKARGSMEVIKKLESLGGLHLRYDETDFSDVKEFEDKLYKLARLLGATILLCDVMGVQSDPINGIRFINIHALSAALKPLMQRGEFLKIKIQRQGKEERQGVGYLDDGTMVVVNGGGDYIGEQIKTRVLSVKHTTSGRMIFSNALLEHEEIGIN